MELARGRDSLSRLELVRIPPVARRQMLEGGVPRVVLHLPEMAELVREEILSRVRAPEQDRPPERIAVVAAKARHTEEPRRDAHAHTREIDRRGVQVEPIEPGLRSLEPRAKVGLSHPGSSSGPGRAPSRGSRPGPGCTPASRSANA